MWISPFNPDMEGTTMSRKPFIPTSSYSQHALEPIVPVKLDNFTHCGCDDCNKLRQEWVWLNHPEQLADHLNALDGEDQDIHPSELGSGDA